MGKLISTSLFAVVVLASCSKPESDLSPVASQANSLNDKASLSSYTQDQADSGRLLHLKILANNPKIDAYYKKPALWGGISDEPLAVICIPIVDWQVLSVAERNCLMAYAASCVTAVRMSPFDFTNISSSAPIAETIRKKVAQMSGRSWGILAGSVSSDGLDIMSDTLVAQGK